MTTLIKMKGVTLPGNGYPNIIDFLVPSFPHPVGLVGLYTFGNRLQMSLVNHANPDLPLIAHGNIESSTDGAVVSRVNYFDTQLLNTDAFSVVSLCLPIFPTTYGAGQIIFGNYKSGDSNQGESMGLAGLNGNGVPSLGLFAPTSANAMVSRFLNLPATSVATRHSGYGGRFAADGKNRMFLMDKGAFVSGEESVVQTRMAHSSRPMLIGTGHNPDNGSWTGKLTVKLLAVWDQALTDQQMFDNIAYLGTLYPDLMSE